MSDRLEPPTTITQPQLNAGGYLRFAVRQLTSMSTALMLLLLLAVASIPGSLIPQRSSDPNGVIQYRENNPELIPFIDFLQLHDVYGSVWFSAIYLLLFISLIGCVIPRTKHHLNALLTPPPRPPSRFSRLPAHLVTSTDDPESTLNDIEKDLRRRGFRVKRFGNDIAGERGYLRETGNLVFHVSLVGVLITFGLLTGFGYTGQKVIIQDQTFGNAIAGYDTFDGGRFFDPNSLENFTLRLDSFVATYDLNLETQNPIPRDYTAKLTTDTGELKTLKVNEPLSIGGTQVYLLGNGFAPVVTVRDGNGDVAFSGPVPFLATDGNLTSVGVIKVPDALPEQLGLLGFFYPTAAPLDSGAMTSISPEPALPLLTFNVFTGDLGLDDGVPQRVYSLNTDDLTQRTGAETGVEPIILGLGQTVDLPDGLGTVSFDDLRRFIGVDISHDPTQGPILLFTSLAFAGILLGLFIPRQRVWARFVEGTDSDIELAALARGDSPELQPLLQRIVDRVNPDGNDRSAP